MAEVEVAVGNAASRFDGDGRLTDERPLAALEKQMTALRACPGPPIASGAGCDPGSGNDNVERGSV